MSRVLDCQVADGIVSQSQACSRDHLWSPCLATDPKPVSVLLQVQLSWVCMMYVMSTGTYQGGMYL